MRLYSEQTNDLQLTCAMKHLGATKNFPDTLIPFEKWDS
jgi:hypothetical protein